MFLLRIASLHISRPVDLVMQSETISSFEREKAMFTLHNVLLFLLGHSS